MMMKKKAHRLTGTHQYRHSKLKEVQNIQKLGASEVTLQYYRAWADK